MTAFTTFSWAELGWLLFSLFVIYFAVEKWLIKKGIVKK